MDDGHGLGVLQVIAVAEREECYNDLIKYLRMARTKQKDSYIDSELLYSLAKCDDRMDELEDFLDATNTANVALLQQSVVVTYDACG